MTPTPSTASNDELITDLRKLDAHIAKAERIRARRYEHLRQRLVARMRESGIGILKIGAARGFNKHRVTNVIYNENSSLSADEWQVLFNFLDRERRRCDVHRIHLEVIAAD